jgi:hypothetical protein
LQKSLSLRSLTGSGTPTGSSSSSKHQSTPYRKPNGSSSLKSPRRLSTYWYETMDNDDIQQMDKMQIERQEVGIFFVFGLCSCLEWISLL